MIELQYYSRSMFVPIYALSQLNNMMLIIIPSYNVQGARTCEITSDLTSNASWSSVSTAARRRVARYARMERHAGGLIDHSTQKSQIQTSLEPTGHCSRVVNDSSHSW